MQNVTPNSDQNQIPASLKFIFSSFEAPPKFKLIYTETKIPLPHFDSREQATFAIKDSDLPKDKRKTLKFCDELLEVLIKNKDLAAFKERVNPKAPNCTNYYQIIKEPMDFTTLQRRLRSGSIPTVGEFKRCLDLIWSNCQTFNPPEHYLSHLAQEVKKEVDSIWDQAKEPPDCLVLDELKQIKENLDKAESIFSKMIVVPPRERIPPPPKPIPYVPPPKEAPPKVAEQPPSQMQLNRIKEKLANTPPGEMEEAWKLLIPFLKKDEILEQRRFNLNELPDATKIELKKIVLK